MRAPGAGGFACRLEFLKASMDELPFFDGYFDLVMTSMALHETPPAVRRAAIAETARLLRPGGTFLRAGRSEGRVRASFFAFRWGEDR